MSTEEKEELEALQRLQSFSGDIIASLSLLRGHDLKKVAYDIEHLFGRHGAVSKLILHDGTEIDTGARSPQQIEEDIKAEDAADLAYAESLKDKPRVQVRRKASAPHILPDSFEAILVVDSPDIHGAYLLDVGGRQDLYSVKDFEVTRLPIKDEKETQV